MKGVRIRKVNCIVGGFYNSLEEGLRIIIVYRRTASAYKIINFEFGKSRPGIKRQ